MAYNTNPFLERTSDDLITSDQEFVQFFSPKVIEKLDRDAFEAGLHIFRSPPGGGKTTLLRAFTPRALRAFRDAKNTPDAREAYRGLVERGVLPDSGAPALLGVKLSCASGYTDLPSGPEISHEGLFRALFDCRVVYRTLRSVAALLGISPDFSDSKIELLYDDSLEALPSIPRTSSADQLIRWATERERDLYASLDVVDTAIDLSVPVAARFESILWLQSLIIRFDGRVVAPKRLLMIDDGQRLRRTQRRLLIEDLVEMRPKIPIWLAERSIALGEDLLVQGARSGRGIRESDLDEIWKKQGGQAQFSAFAQNILERRLKSQSAIPPSAFAQYLREELDETEIEEPIQVGIKGFQSEVERHRGNPRYQGWLQHAEQLIENPSLETLLELYVTRILLMRDQGKRQLNLDLEPLSTADLNARDGSDVRAAAELFVNSETGIPFYFGIERLCAMSSTNIEELLLLAASLYDGIKARQDLRKPELVLPPLEQEKLLKAAAKKKYKFIPKGHTHGTRAQRLLDSIGAFCRERTFQPNAPIAPGVTGVRLSSNEIAELSSTSGRPKEIQTLRSVLSECVAENLLIKKDSSATTSRKPGTVFYLNRTLCCHYGLPLQFGGWQERTARDLLEWMEHGRTLSSIKLEID